MATQKLNLLSAPTFSWLDVNGVERELPDTAPEIIRVNANEDRITRLDITDSTDLTVQSSGTVIMNIAADPCGIRGTNQIHSGISERFRRQ